MKFTININNEYFKNEKITNLWKYKDNDDNIIIYIVKLVLLISLLIIISIQSNIN